MESYVFLGKERILESDACEIRIRFLMLFLVASSGLIPLF
jgi:hypothetical protein